MSLAFNTGWLFGIAFCVVLSTWALTSRIDECERRGEGLCIVRVDWSRLPTNVPITFIPVSEISP